MKMKAGPLILAETMPFMSLKQQLGGVIALGLEKDGAKKIWRHKSRQSFKEFCYKQNQKWDNSCKKNQNQERV